MKDELMRTKARLYIRPGVSMVTIYAECSGIGIGSGNTTPEDCESNTGELETNITPKSVWDI